MSCCMLPSQNTVDSFREGVVMGIWRAFSSKYTSSGVHSILHVSLTLKWVFVFDVYVK